MQQFILDVQRPVPDLSGIRAAGEMLHAAQGQVTISQLAEHSHLSQSQFERRFKYLTGVSPKTYARLVRFEGARASLLDNPWRSIVDIAQENGYSDQAHFTHEFRSFTAQTPGEFAAQLRSLTG